MVQKILVTYDDRLPAYSEYIRRMTGESLSDANLVERRHEQNIFDDNLWTLNMLDAFKIVKFLVYT